MSGLITKSNGVNSALSMDGKGRMSKYSNSYADIIRSEIG